MTEDGVGDRIRWFGTDEPIPARRLLSVGRLSAELESGALRRIRWDGKEILRAIGFVLRDSRWGTYRIEPGDFEVVERPDGFEVAYLAAVEGHEGGFEFAARILGSAGGHLRFEVRGSSPGGFTTNRTGFVVLHPLEGTVGETCVVEHTTGASSRSRFPELVAPDQPMTDIALLRHEPAPGLTLTVRFEGDAFEMEDHRNWTDASFKTYVRPLARGFPYLIESRREIMQAIDVTVEGHVHASPRAPNTDIRLRWSEAIGEPMPLVGLFLDPDADPPSPATVSGTAKLRPGYVQVRTNLCAPECLARLGADLDVASALGCPTHLDVVIPGIDPFAELVPLAAFLAGRHQTIAALFPIPVRDCASRQPRQVPDGEAGPEHILGAARSLFAGPQLVAGVPVGFAEFNRNRPPPGADMIAHATHAVVHAADDRSVIETLEAMPYVIRTALTHAGNVAYRLGPCTIGMPICTSASRPVITEDNRRSPIAMNDPRQRGCFAAAFAFGVAAAARGTTHLTLAAPAGAFGLLHEHQEWPTPGRVRGDRYPIADAFALLSGLAGRPRLEVSHDGSDRIAAIATMTAEGPVLHLANMTQDPITVSLDGAMTPDTDVVHRMPDDRPQSYRASQVRLGPFCITSARLK